jgi:hypothetical protein
LRKFDRCGPEPPDGAVATQRYRFDGRLAQRVGYAMPRAMTCKNHT